MHDFGPKINTKIGILITANAQNLDTALTTPELVRIIVPMLEPSSTEYTTITAIKAELSNIMYSVPNNIQIGLALHAMGLKSKPVKTNGRVLRVYVGIRLKKGN